MRMNGNQPGLEMATLAGEESAPPPKPEQPAPQPAPTQESEPARDATPAAVLDRPSPRRLPNFKVLLHNDDVNTPMHVVESLVELTPLDPHGATAVMKEAHTTGLALVLVTHRERAELYQEQLASKSLTVTVEPE